MASKHEIIGEEWRARSSELADWAMANLVNRKDVWGQYSLPTPTEQRQSGRTYKAMTLPAKAQRGGDKVTLDKLTRHFASRRLRKPQLIGLHAKSEQATSRWLGIDVDCHDTEASSAEDLARRNLNAVVNWHRKLQSMGYDPVLFDSNGAGGFHLWILFAEPVDTAVVFDFGQWLLADWREQHLEKLPETFPKAVKEESIGSWFRLPGLHHTRDHYSAVWAGDDGFDNPWLTGHAAIDAMLAAIPGPAPAINARDAGQPASVPSAAKDAEPGDTTAPVTRGKFKRTTLPTVCVDLDGILARRASGSSIGPPIDGAVEFTRNLAAQANILVYTARFSTRSGKARTESAVSTLHRRIENWLDNHGFAYTAIHTGPAKPIASAYVDDRAVPCRPLDNGLAEFDHALAAVEKLCDQD